MKVVKISQNLQISNIKVMHYVEKRVIQLEQTQKIYYQPGKKLTWSIK